MILFNGAPIDEHSVVIDVSGTPLTGVWWFVPLEQRPGPSYRLLYSQSEFTPVPTRGHVVGLFHQAGLAEAHRYAMQHATRLLPFGFS